MICKYSMKYLLQLFFVMLFRPCGFHLLHFPIQSDLFAGALVLFVEEPSSLIVSQNWHPFLH